MPRSEWSAKWSLRYAQKRSKSGAKNSDQITCHYTWLLHGKNCPSWWRFLKSLLTASKPTRRSITAAKRKEKEKKKRRKKIEKPKDIGHFLLQNFYFCACPSENVQNAMPVARKPSCRDASAFVTRLKVIWLRSKPKTTKMSKKRLFAKSSGSQWVKHNAKNILIHFFTSRVCSQSTLILFLEQIAPLPAATTTTTTTFI